MPETPPTVGILAGQLGYLFEDEPDLRIASDATLTARLNHDDRYARARQHYPAETDAFVTAHLDDFPERINPELVHEARAEIRG